MKEIKGYAITYLYLPLVLEVCSEREMRQRKTKGQHNDSEHQWV